VKAMEVDLKSATEALDAETGADSKRYTQFVCLIAALILPVICYFHVLLLSLHCCFYSALNDCLLCADVPLCNCSLTLCCYVSSLFTTVFTVAGPKTWNALSEDVTSSQSEYTFHCQLKTWLFKKFLSDTDCILTFSLGLSVPTLRSSAV